MDPDPIAVADMLRAIDVSIRSLPEGLSYIVLSRYVPPSVAIVRRDDLGRRYVLAGEELIDRLERGEHDGPLYHGIPIVRVVGTAAQSQRDAEANHSR